MGDDMRCTRCGAYAPHYAECDACHATSFPSDLASRALDVLREILLVLAESPDDGNEAIADATDRARALLAEVDR